MLKSLTERSELTGSIENTSWGTTSIALSPDGKWLATGNPIGEPYPLSQAGQVTAVAFSTQGDHLVAGGYSGKTFAWQVSPLTRTAKLTGAPEVTERVTP
jgi:WD40 repeat protein